MKILHTSDWHLGKYLENYKRIEEQICFIDELNEIADKNFVDLIVVAGDIYDTINPSIQAEKLFYDSMKKLSKNGSRPIIISAGNHDSPDKLQAVSPLALENGIIIASTLKTIVKVGDYKNFKIIDSGEGYFEIELKNEKIVVVNLGYPSETRINDFIYESLANEKIEIDFQNKIEDIIKNLSKKYRSDTINYFIGHFYITGGITEDSERDISLGGSFSVDSSILPENAHYVAMGHLHRPQKVALSKIKHAYYSGSPIQYNKSEINHSKCVYIADISLGKETIVEKIYLHNYRPIEIWKVNGIANALNLCKERKNSDCYVYLEIITSEILKQSEIKELRQIKNNILEIKPIINDCNQNTHTFQEEKTIEEEFMDFYINKRQVPPNKELLNIFKNLINELNEGCESGETC